MYSAEVNEGSTGAPLKLVTSEVKMMHHSLLCSHTVTCDMVCAALSVPPFPAVMPRYLTPKL